MSSFKLFFRQKDQTRVEVVAQVLEKRRANFDNWAYSYWLDEMYMQPRLPLPVNSNPGGVESVSPIPLAITIFNQSTTDILELLGLLQISISYNRTLNIFIAKIIAINIILKPSHKSD